MAEREEDPGPSRKKVKTCSAFNPETLRKHKTSIEAAVGRLDAFMFCFVKLSACNGDYSTCFSNAWCESTRNIEECQENGQSKVAKFAELFDTDILQRVLNGPVDLTPTQHTAFQRLELFLENIEEISRILVENICEDTSEADLTGLIGTHVLKQLAVNQQMTISDPGYSNRNAHCSCKNEKCKDKLRYGDTSLGHPTVWHGSVDILLGPVAVDVVDDIEENAEEVNSIVEQKTDLFELHRDRLIAEAIVCGFVQNQGLVPLVAISKEQVKLYLYSPDHDLLYESMECYLFLNIRDGQKESKILSHSVTILLWFALNYQIFLKVVDPSHLENAYTSDFKTLIQKRDEVLYTYENGLRFGGCKNAERIKPNLIFFEY